MCRQFALFGRRLGGDEHGSLLYLADDIGSLQGLIERNDGDLFWIKNRYYPFQAAFICNLVTGTTVSSYRVTSGRGEWAAELEEAGIRVLDTSDPKVAAPMLPTGGRLESGAKLTHRHWGSVVASYTPELGWHYQRFGYAGHDTDFENIIAAGWDSSAIEDAVLEMSKAQIVRPDITVVQITVPDPRTADLRGADLSRAAV